MNDLSAEVSAVLRAEIAAIKSQVIDCENCGAPIAPGEFRCEQFAHGVTRIICGDCFDAWHREHPNSGVFE